MEKRRSNAQDIAKGMMIIGVVFFHCYLEVFSSPADALSTFNPLVACFPFILSTFFFYAGYNYKPDTRTYKQHIARRAKQLLIPLLFAFIISTVLISSMELAFHFDNPGATFQSIGNSILYFLMSEPTALIVGFPRSGGIIFELMLSLCLLWFLYTLFFCSLFFYWLVKYTNKRLTTLVSVVILLLSISFCVVQFVPYGNYLPFQVQSYPVVLSIMLVGAYLRKSNFLDRPVSGKKGIALLVANALIAEALVAGISLALHYAFGTMTVGSMPGSKFDPAILGFDVFACFGFGILGVYFVHTMARGISLIPFVSSGFQWMGRHSSLFYLFHPIFLDLAAICIFQKNIPWGRGQAFFYLAVVLAMMCLVFFLIDLIVKSIKNKKRNEAN